MNFESNLTTTKELKIDNDLVKNFFEARVLLSEVLAFRADASDPRLHLLEQIAPANLEEDGRVTLSLNSNGHSSTVNLNDQDLTHYLELIEQNISLHEYKTLRPQGF